MRERRKKKREKNEKQKQEEGGCKIPTQSTLITNKDGDGNENSGIIQLRSNAGCEDIIAVDF